MDIEIRSTRHDELRAACNAMCKALLTSPPDDDRWAKSLAAWESSISFSAWDGDECVGHAANLEVETTVPGGETLTTGAVTWVGVLTTHARRGAGTGLMRALILDAAERGWPLMSLRASESTIYRRYGFGVAGDFAAVEIDARRARPVRGAATGTMRLLTAAEIPAVVDDVYRRCLGRRPGLITRPDPWAERHFRAVGEAKDNALVAVHVDEQGEPDGYVYYTTSWFESPLEQGGKGVIHDVFAVSDDVELALWRYLFTIDLVGTWTSQGRPLDDLVIEAVADRRAYRVTSVIDEQWLRLVDVDASLQARTYAPGPDGIVVAVVDPMIDANNGRWRIDGSGARRTDEPADLTADIDAISALYLGGMSWRTEAAVGRVRPAPSVAGERLQSALAAADRLFSVRPLPFCGTFF